VFVKSTEGSTWTSSQAAAQLKAARDKRLNVGHYYFMRTGNAVRQARWFVAKTGIKPGDLLVCDWENTPEGHPSVADVDQRGLEKRAAAGEVVRSSTKYWRTSTEQPATSGQAMLVPPIYAYDRLWSARPQKFSSGASFDRVEMMSVPGATMSGLIRRSSQGPRVLKAVVASESPDSSCSAIGGFGKSRGHLLPYVRPDSPPVVRLLRAAPTVSAFLHDVGEPIERANRRSQVRS
jgi:Glycosyl hydrolases family 25